MILNQGILFSVSHKIWKFDKVIGTNIAMMVHEVVEELNNADLHKKCMGIELIVKSIF